MLLLSAKLEIILLYRKELIYVFLKNLVVVPSSSGITYYLNQTLLHSKIWITVLAGIFILYSFYINKSCWKQQAWMMCPNWLWNADQASAELQINNMTRKKQLYLGAFLLCFRQLKYTCPCFTFSCMFFQILEIFFDIFLDFLMSSPCEINIWNIYEGSDLKNKLLILW